MSLLLLLNTMAKLASLTTSHTETPNQSLSTLDNATRDLIFIFITAGWTLRSPAGSWVYDHGNR